MSPQLRAEYDKISVSSVTSGRSTRSRNYGKSVQRPTTSLNLSQFAYGERGTFAGASTPKGVTSSSGHGRDPQKATNAGRVAKPARKSKKSRVQNGHEKTRAMSGFARAVEYHRRREAGGA